MKVWYWPELDKLFLVGKYKDQYLIMGDERVSIINFKIPPKMKGWILLGDL